MKLYLVRHGIASNGYPDEQRGLTSEGITSLKKSVQVWQNYIYHLEYIICSPLLRAKQTAEIIKSELILESQLFTDNLLAPGSDAHDLLNLVNSLEADNIMVVGHLPDLANQASSFISNSGAYIHFTPGTIASIIFKDQIRISGGAVNFLIPPII